MKESQIFRFKLLNDTYFDFKKNYIGNIEDGDDFLHFFDGGWEDK